MSVEIVVGKELIKKGPIKTESRPITTKEKFLEDLDANALPVFKAIFELAAKNNLPVRWGAVGFSLSTIVDDVVVPILQGYPKSPYNQIIYTYSCAVRKKVENGNELFEWFSEKLLETKLFEKTKIELKYKINKKPSAEEIEHLTELITSFSEKIKQNGIIQ